MARKTTVVGFSVPPAVARDVEVMARKERKTKSELFRAMVDVYTRYRDVREYERLAAYGAAKASRVGVATEADLERLLPDSQFD